MFGVGYSCGYFTEDDPANYPRNCESVTEAYYNIKINDWFVVSPNMQYVANPTDGAGTEITDAFVLGLRTSLSF